MKLNSPQQICVINTQIQLRAQIQLTHSLHTKYTCGSKKLQPDLEGNVSLEVRLEGRDGSQGRERHSQEYITR